MQAFTLTKQQDGALVQGERSRSCILYVFPRIASHRWFCILISRLSQYSLGNRQRRCSLYILYNSAFVTLHRHHRRSRASFGRSLSVVTCIDVRRPKKCNWNGLGLIFEHARSIFTFVNTDLSVFGQICSTWHFQIFHFTLICSFLNYSV